MHNIHSLLSSSSAPIQAAESGRSGRGSNLRNDHGIRLRPVSELPDIYRGLFKFGVFNAVQSSCFETVRLVPLQPVVALIEMLTRSCTPASAPTGSGKTVLFELAIIRMMIQAGSNNRNVRCIYVAPTKSLCSEKFRDWSTKFQPIGMNCVELTGDTLQTGRSAWRSAKDANIIVTTGEKWDSLTRNWRSYGQVLAQIQLFLVDEVHILTESRGSTLEVILSRMKTRGSSVRFVVVSATVPNIDDVARWIGDGNGGSATVMQFGEEFRPCKISKFVYGIQRKRDHNDFVFNRVLDGQLYKIIQKHSVNNPMLIFCSTRKGVTTTAEQLLKDYENAAENKQSLPWSRPLRYVFLELAACGIGVHHAGMTMSDRRTIEDLFLKKILRIVVSTSTLAVGVNLPAHTVVIKGVKIFQNNMSQEYSDLDIMQMIGRAGRPQFDKEGVAIILCESELEAKYKALVKGQTVLESCLHLNLPEHVNSEVGLGTITDVETAKEWLRNSFLFQRIQKNPRHYAIGKDSNQTWQERIDQMVTQSIGTLRDSQLLEYSDEASGQLASTEFGEIMSTFYIRHTTMSLILRIPENTSLKDIVYNKLRENEDIRFKMRKVEKSSDKVFLIVQAVLGAINLSDPAYRGSDSQPSLEAPGIFRHITRIAKAVVEVAVVKKAGRMLLYGLEALRCLTSRAWEDRPSVLRQLDQIGEKSSVPPYLLIPNNILAQNGITSFDILRVENPMRLEALLNRKPPFGHELIASAKEFPQYQLGITEVDVAASDGKRPLQVELTIECSAVLPKATNAKQKKAKQKGLDMTVVLTLTSDMEFIDFRRIETKSLIEPKDFLITAELMRPSQNVVVYISSELDLEGLDDDLDFWNMSANDDEGVSDQQPPSPSKSRPDNRRGLKGSVRPIACPTANMSAFRQSWWMRILSTFCRCNHTCKDKTKCLHLCCREGIAKPVWSKKRVEALCAVVESQQDCGRSQTSTSGYVHVLRSEDAASSKTRPKAKLKPCDARNRQMEQLDALHENIGVVESIKLNKGHRLKLDDSATSDARSIGKARATPNFNLDFMCLDHEKSAVIDIKSGDSDDELPEPHELLDTYKQPSRGRPSLPTPVSESDYSNSEIDALIRELPAE
ncbi:P-loop containing nucleoside triphosphate hydrolase protein, partial [Obba rivulosa]